MLIIALLLAIGPAVAFQPSPGSLTFEQLIERYQAELKESDDAKKRADATREEIRKRYRELAEKLKDILPAVPPGPGPGPVVPPKPDPLAEKIKEAAKADGSTKSELQALSALYAECASVCRSKDLASGNDLLTRLQKASSRMVGATSCLGVRKIVSGELGAALGSPSDDPLSAAQCEAAAMLFEKLAKVLEET